MIHLLLVGCGLRGPAITMSARARAFLAFTTNPFSKGNAISLAHLGDKIWYKSLSRFRGFAADSRECRHQGAQVTRARDEDARACARTRAHRGPRRQAGQGEPRPLRARRPSRLEGYAGRWPSPTRLASIKNKSIRLQIFDRQGT
jgi:hypothetical protein